MFIHSRFALVSLVLWGIIVTWYSMASFFLLPGWNTSVWVWDNNNFIDSSFWPMVTTGSDIKNAVYGADPIDPTAYTQYFSGSHTCNTGMVVDVIQSWFNTIPEFLTGNTIYVLDEGDYISDRTITANNNCTAIIWYETVNLYSSGFLINWMLLIDWDFNVLDNLLIDSEFDWTSNHAKNALWVAIHWYNNTVHKVEALSAETVFTLSWSYIYMDNIIAHGGDNYWIRAVWGQGESYRLENIEVYDNAYWADIRPWIIAWISNLYINNFSWYNNTAAAFVTFAISSGSFNNFSLENNGYWIAFAGDFWSWTVSLVDNTSLNNIFIDQTDNAVYIATGSTNIDIMGLEVYNAMTWLDMIWVSWFTMTSSKIYDSINIALLSTDSDNMNLVDSIFSWGTNTGMVFYNNNNILFTWVTALQFAGSDCIYIENSDDIEFFDSKAIWCNANGILVKNSTNFITNKVTVAWNGQNWIQIENVTWATMTHTLAEQNDSWIEINGSTNIDITYAKTFNGGAAWIWLRGTTSHVNISHVVSFNNTESWIWTVDFWVLDHIAISNVTTFNNESGISFENIGNSTLSDIYTFNNDWGVWFTNWSWNFLNNITMRNNWYWLYAQSWSVNNEIHWAIRFLWNDVDFCYSELWTVSCDSSTLPYVGYFDSNLSTPVASWNLLTIWTSTRPMTCHQAINPESIAWELLSYPYCNERAKNISWTTLENAYLLTFFQEVPKQNQTVQYSSWVLVEAWIFNTELFVGDFNLDELVPTVIGWHADVKNETDLVESWGLIYKTSSAPIDVELYSVWWPSEYGSDGDQDTVLSWFINAWQFITTGQYNMTSTPNWMKIIKMLYKDGIESNYYWVMRFMDIPDAQFSISKTLLTTWNIYPWDFVIFNIDFEYVTWSETIETTIIDWAENPGLDFISATWTITLALTWQILSWPVVGAGFEWWFVNPWDTWNVQITFQVDPAFTWSTLTNSGGIAWPDGPQIEDPWNWFVTDALTIAIGSGSVSPISVTKTLLTTWDIYYNGEATFRIEIDYSSWSTVLSWVVTDMFPEWWTYITWSQSLTWLGIVTWFNNNQIVTFSPPASMLTWSDWFLPWTTGYIDITFNIWVNWSWNLNLTNTWIVSPYGVDETEYYNNLDDFLTWYWYDEETIVALRPEFEVIKTLITTGTISPWDYITFDLYIWYNTWNVIYERLQITDMFPSWLLFVSWSTIDYWQTGFNWNTIITFDPPVWLYTWVLWSWARIQPGWSWFITLTFQVDPAYLWTSITNTGVITLAWDQPNAYFNALWNANLWFGYDDVTFPVQQPTGGWPSGWGGPSGWCTSNCGWGGWGWQELPLDNCPGWDFSPSFYDGICGQAPTPEPTLTPVQPIKEPVLLPSAPELEPDYALPAILPKTWPDINEYIRNLQAKNK